MITNFCKKRLFSITSVIILLFGATGCKENRLKIDVSEVKAEVTFKRFDKDLFDIDTNAMQVAFTNLNKKYPDFFPSYYSEIISLGNFDDSTAPDKLKQFINYQPTQQLFSVIEKKFVSVDEYNAQITEAFKHVKHYFPDDTLPEIIYFPGILNNGCIYYGKQIAVGLDMYLGKDYPYEKMPHLTNYLTVKMRPEYLTRNVINALGYYRYERFLKGKRFIDQMIHEGKLAYYIDAMMPETPDSIKLALTGENLKWCKDNEWQIWAHFVDPKLNVLYNNNPEVIIRYFEEGPFTNADGVPNDETRSSPRFAVWVGREIVRRYMDNNPKITLAELMRETDSDKILKGSKYRP